MSGLLSLLKQNPLLAAMMGLQSVTIIVLFVALLMVSRVGDEASYASARAQDAESAASACASESEVKQHLERLSAEVRAIDNHYGALDSIQASCAMARWR